MTTVKTPFWKSVCKSLIVMVMIIVVCGGLLAIVNDLCKVTDEERIQRAIDKIYDTDVKLDDTIDVSNYNENLDIAEIKACYKLNNGDYLVRTTGKKGYSNGSVTLYVSISIEDDVAKVNITVMDDYKGQTLMSKLNDLYNKFIGKTADDDLSSIIETGATYSSVAVQNAIKGSLLFVESIK